MVNGEDAKWMTSQNVTDSFNDVKSFITNKMGSLIRFGNSEGSILQTMVSALNKINIIF